ncbi:MAG: peptidoglycan recognition family protein [Leptolyngbyaceae cyanobacterium bins.302]|nr:peptidoglycan recognition family protein [Leptolyngbyaceae cyanobacterium bins.302]
MKRKLLTAIALCALCLITLTVAVNSGRAQRNEFESPRLPTPKVAQQQQLERAIPDQALPTDCAIQPGSKSLRSSGSKPMQRTQTSIANAPITLERFRRLQPTDLSKTSVDLGKASATKQRPTPAYTPQELIALIHPTNYGDRFLRDVNGKPANQQPIVVLHETVASVSSTLNFFRTPHPRDEDQASYHTLIRRDGAIIYLVPPDKRAYGAGNSVFNGDQGSEAVKTHARFPASVNNFAYHVSLETPGDGINNAARHSGYTEAQYQSLAWLVAKTAVADNRITTHKAVDRSESRMDPRSFSFSRFFQLLQTYTKTDEIPLRCTVPPEALQSKRPAVTARKQAVRSK